MAPDSHKQPGEDCYRACACIRPTQLLVRSVHRLAVVEAILEMYMTQLVEAPPSAHIAERVACEDSLLHVIVMKPSPSTRHVSSKETQRAHTSVATASTWINGVHFLGFVYQVLMHSRVCYTGLWGPSTVTLQI